MLDQNTDRTWWMIAAVAIGGVMYGLSKTAFPNALKAGLKFLGDTMGVPFGVE